VTIEVPFAFLICFDFAKLKKTKEDIKDKNHTKKLTHLSEAN
jgi:hypothetical protein